MEFPAPPPIISARDVLPTLGFVPVWGTPTDLEPAFEFKGSGIDIRIAQVTSLYLRPEFLIGGVASNGRSLKYIEQSMPLALESRDQVVAWVAFAVGIDFRTRVPVRWFDEGRNLQHLLPWERWRLEQRAKSEANARLRLERPPCQVEREALRQLLNVGAQAVGWPPAPGRFTLSFDGEMLKLRACSRVAAVQAAGAAWLNAFSGELRHLHAMPRRLEGELVEVAVWDDMLHVGRVRIPVEVVLAAQ